MDFRSFWTRIAADDLESVVQNVELDNPPAAAAIAKEALAAADRIAEFPEAGSIVPEFDDATLREVLVKRSFRLMYRIKTRACYVVAFLHHARDVSQLAKERSFDV